MPKHSHPGVTRGMISSQGGGGGGTLICSYIHRLGSFFGVQNFEFQYFGGFSEKYFFLGGMKILWILILGHHKNWTIFRGYIYAF